MGLKDQIDKLRNYFVEDDEEFDIPERPVSQPAPATQKVEKAPEVKKAPVAQNRPKPQAAPRPQTQARPAAEQRPKRPSMFSNNNERTEKKVQQATNNTATTVVKPMIAIKEPRAYTDIMESARIVKNGESVLVNFKFMSDTQARRSIDFLTGVVFTLDGDVQNVGGQIFLVTPANITVDASKDLSVLSGQNFESYDLYQ